jgi:hypothetical protein
VKERSAGTLEMLKSNKIIPITHILNGSWSFLQVLYESVVK